MDNEISSGNWGIGCIAVETVLQLQAGVFFFDWGAATTNAALEIKTKRTEAAWRLSISLLRARESFVAHLKINLGQL